METRVILVDSLVNRLVGESIEMLIEKHSAVVVLTENHAIKIYSAQQRESLPRERISRECAWLREHGQLECELQEGTDANGTPNIAIVMPRLPDEACVGRQMVERTLSLNAIDSISSRVADLGGGARSMTTTSRSAQALRKNLDRQLSLLGDHVPKSLAKEIRRQSYSAITLWHHSAPQLAVATVGHANLFSPNVFLLGRQCVLIDPGLLYQEARLVPHFTELAPLIADLEIHDYAHLSKSLASNTSDQVLTESERDILRTSVITKILVRIRFELLEADKPTDITWITEQNELIRRRGLSVVVQALGTV